MTQSHDRAVEEACKARGVRLLSWEEAKRDVAQKLLSGWCMTDVNCPLTQFPLLRDKKHGSFWSPRLGMEIKFQEEGSVSADESSSTQRNASFSTTDDVVSIPHTSASTNVESKSITTASSSSRNSMTTTAPPDYSKLLGEKLLMGWVMLAEECPHTHAVPLMMDPATGRRWSAGLNDYVDDGNLEAVLATSSPAPVDEEKIGNDENDDGDDDEELEDDVLSERIGERLLKGYTMLSQSCPVTHRCPLLRDPRSGDLYSAALDRTLTPAERAKCFSSPGENGMRMDSTAARASSSSSSSSSSTFANDAGRENGMTKTSVIPAHGSDSRTVPSSSVSPESLRGELDLVSASLVRKLSGWAERLERESERTSERETLGLMTEAVALLRSIGDLHMRV